MPKGEGVLYKKGTSESWINKSKDHDKKLRYSYKEPNKDMGKEDNACVCDVSKDKSCNLEAHDRSTWAGGLRTEGT
jgi:hypothetical protein